MQKTIDRFFHRRVHAVVCSQPHKAAHEKALCALNLATTPTHELQPRFTAASSSSSSVSGFMVQHGPEKRLLASHLGLPEKGYHLPQIIDAALKVQAETIFLLQCREHNNVLFHEVVRAPSRNWFATLTTSFPGKRACVLHDPASLSLPLVSSTSSSASDVTQDSSVQVSERGATGRKARTRLPGTSFCVTLV